jgi:hypothetical protein
MSRTDARASGHLAALGTLLLLTAGACGTRTTDLAFSAPRELDGGALDAGRDAEPVFRFDDAGVVMCGSRACACSDGLDNDSDDAFDGFDPECTGAFDDYEDSFATGSHGEDQTGKRQDCFYDGNSGGGDDGCNRARCCAAGGADAPADPSCNDCTVDARCSATCAPLAPNGCDCFGCCGIWRGDVVTHVLLGSGSCSVDSVADPSLCPRCRPARDCENPCGPCELCPGRALRDLPLGCETPGGPGYSCDESQTCAGAADCEGLSSCQQGCCLRTGI